MALLDGLGVWAFFNLAYWQRFGFVHQTWAMTWEVYSFYLVATIVLYVFNLNRFEQNLKFGQFIWRFSSASLLIIGMNLASYFLLGKQGDIVGRGVLFPAFIFFLLWSAFWRVSLNGLLNRRNQQQSWLFVLESEHFLAIEPDLKQFHRQGEVEVYDARQQQKWTYDPQEGMIDQSQVGRLGELLGEKRYTGLILRNAQTLNSEDWQHIVSYRIKGNRVFDLADFFERFLNRLPVYHISKDWFALTHGFTLLHNPVGFKVKRLVDIFLSLILLIGTSPIMLLTALFVKLDSQGPVFYKQKRNGWQGREFFIIKFRSMRTDAENGKAQWAQKNDSRVTRVGRFIRLTRIDELPQTWNVLTGEMSFIGPRPERPEFNGELEEVIPFYDFRHLVKPGITGWAQVNYPYGASLEDAEKKLQYDLYYIKNYSLFIDLEIVFKTIGIVLFGKGR